MTAIASRFTRSGANYRGGRLLDYAAEDDCGGFSNPKVRRVLSTVGEIVGSLLLFVLAGLICYLVMIVTDYHWC